MSLSNNRRFLLEIFISAGIGAALALAIDSAVAWEQSMIFTVAAVVPATTRSPSFVPPVVAASLLLVGFGGLSTLYFRPLSNKGALACGFAAIAVLSLFIH